MPNYRQNLADFVGKRNDILTESDVVSAVGMAGLDDMVKAKKLTATEEAPTFVAKRPTTALKDLTADRVQEERNEAITQNVQLKEMLRQTQDVAKVQERTINELRESAGNKALEEAKFQGHMKAQALEMEGLREQILALTKELESVDALKRERDALKAENDRLKAKADRSK